MGRKTPREKEDEDKENNIKDNEKEEDEEEEKNNGKCHRNVSGRVVRCEQALLGHVSGPLRATEWRV
jgi:hypothetical protein